MAARTQCECTSILHAAVPVAALVGIIQIYVHCDDPEIALDGIHLYMTADRNGVIRYDDWYDGWTAFMGRMTEMAYLRLDTTFCIGARLIYEGYSTDHRTSSAELIAFIARDHDGLIRSMERAQNDTPALTSAPPALVALCTAAHKVIEQWRASRPYWIQHA